MKSLVKSFSTGGGGVYHETQCRVHVVVDKEEHLGVRVL